MKQPIELEELCKQVLDNQEVEEAMQEFAFNMRFELKGLTRYGMRKIVRFATVVAYATMLGLPLDMFKATPEDIAAHLQKIIDAAEEAGIPTFVIKDTDVQG